MSGLVPNGLSFNSRGFNMNPVPSVAVNLGTAGNKKKDGNEVAVDLRQRSSNYGSSIKDHHPSGNFPSFKKPRFPVISKVFKELRHIFSDQRAKRIIGLIIFVTTSTAFLFSLCKESNSKALLAYTYLSIIDLSILFTCLMSIWVEQQRPTPTFTFGYGRFEVLSVFSSAVLGLLGAFFVIKECLGRLFFEEQYTVEGNALLLGTGLGFTSRLLVVLFADSKAWNHVIGASKSNWLQRQVAETSENLCQLLPGLSRFLLPRINPLALVVHIGAALLLIAQFLIQLKGYYMADDVVALFLALFVCITMYPLFAFTGLILLQTTPSHVLSHLDKCLREAATLDGVLEFRNEHFWTVSFGVLAGSLHVRVRRDANEQLVLSHLTSRLSGLVPVLTIQVFKDDWTRSATTLQLLSDSARATAGASSATGASMLHVPSQSHVPPPYATGASTLTTSGIPGYNSGRPFSQQPPVQSKPIIPMV